MSTQKTSLLFSRIRRLVNLRSAQSPRLWAVRRTTQHLGFLTSRLLFSLRRRILEANIGALSTVSLVWLCLGQLVKAIVLAWLLVTANEFLLSVRPAWFPNVNNDTYTSLLATITAIGGVFIGLYYTAISVVAGTAYAEVPNNIRDLLARERIGNIYMRTLSLLTVLGLVLLVIDALGYPPLEYGVVLIGMWSAFTVFAFVSLGARAFHLFDPTSLSNNLFEELRRNQRQVRVGGFKWRDSALQSHAHREASSILETVLTLASITEREPHLNGKPYVSLCKNLISFLIHYENARKQIPTNSRWYGQRTVHPVWYQSSGSNVTIAHQFATSLMPTTESDFRWIENRILPVICNCLEVNVTQGRAELVHEVLQDIHAYVNKLGQEGQVDFAFSFARQVFDLMAKALLKPVDIPRSREPAAHSAMVEQLAMLPLTILLAYVETIGDRSRNAVEAQLKRVKWSHSSGIYKAGFHQQDLKKLEWLQQRLSVEQQVEGEVISPDWYLEELMRSNSSLYFEQSLNILYDEALSIYEQWIKVATEANHPIFSAIFVTREYEYIDKLEAHEETYARNWNEHLEPREIKGLDWPSIEFEELKQRAKRHKLTLLRSMSIEASTLLTIERTDSIPDFAGQFLHFVAESLIEAMYENNSLQVRHVFTHYLCASIGQFLQIRPEGNLDDWREQIKLKTSIAPLLDLMDLSGYAYLYASYRGESALKDAIAGAWDHYLNANKDRQPLALLGAVVTLAEQPLEMPHRSDVRYRWRQTAARRLKGLERRAFSQSGVNELVPELYVMHEDPLVRVFADDRFSFYDGIDIFLDMYVRHRNDYQSSDFGTRQRKDLTTAITTEDLRFSNRGDRESN